MDKYAQFGQNPNKFGQFGSFQGGNQAGDGKEKGEI